MNQREELARGGPAHIPPDAPVGAQGLTPAAERIASAGTRFPRRHHLYLWVWMVPAVHVGQELGISGPALRKRCDKHNIPMPGRGYWSQTRVGLHLPVTPLPSADDDPELDFEVTAQRFELLNQLPWPPRPTLGEIGRSGPPPVAALVAPIAAQAVQADTEMPPRVAVVEPSADALPGGTDSAERQSRIEAVLQPQVPRGIAFRLQEQARKLREVEEVLRDLAVETAAILAMR